MQTIELSPLSKAWLIDIDGTIFQHNGYLNGADQLLPGVAEFFNDLPSTDKIILLTARRQQFKDSTLAALTHHGIRYDSVLFDMPLGERILINDTKPSGLQTAYAINVARDAGLGQISAALKIVDK
ncbi:HAD family hydrolase [Sapientia aquatica]|uniref:FCP1 homology domain-containing protein n=1 Tax=Sapientia aquatica TaxID=1549640 RepID=A0A4R5W3Y0_9BURK|nr:hypothetical protein [Sapientia aquatica]TDK67449.1 hypothetical protein E2I14_06770 [Sapientia aquatica]